MMIKFNKKELDLINLYQKKIKNGFFSINK